MAQIVKLCGDNITLISGDDALTVPVLSIGGTGVISVVANIVPAEVAKMIELFAKGRIEESRKTYFRLLPLIKAMFIETNPIPVKTALGMMGKILPQLRLPLCPMLPENEEKLKLVLKDYRLL
jgi:4-hydroxy-tetrahydrodipicolinate synthase